MFMTSSMRLKFVFSIKHQKLQRQLYQTFPKQHILDSSKLEKFADSNFKFDENGRKFFKPIGNSAGKGEIAHTSNFSFSHSVFKRLVQQTHKNQGLFGTGLMSININIT